MSDGGILAQVTFTDTPGRVSATDDDDEGVRQAKDVAMTVEETYDDHLAIGSDGCGGGDGGGVHDPRRPHSSRRRRETSTTTVRRLPRGIKNVSGVSCHISAALQLIFHGLPEVRDVLLEFSRMKTLTTTSSEDSPPTRLRDYGGERDQGCATTEKTAKKTDPGMDHSEVRPPVGRTAGTMTNDSDDRRSKGIFIAELARLFSELAEVDPPPLATESERTEGEMSGDEPPSLPAAGCPVDPTRFYEKALPPTLDCHNLGDGATALRVLLTALRTSCENGLIGEEGKSLREEEEEEVGRIHSRLRDAIVSGLDGTSVQRIRGSKIVRVPRDRRDVAVDVGTDRDSDGTCINFPTEEVAENDEVRSNTSEDKLLGSESERTKKAEDLVINEGSEGDSEEGGAERTEDFKDSGSHLNVDGAASDKAASEPCEGGDGEGSIDPSDSKKSDLDSSSDSDSDSDTDELTLVRKRITRTKPDRERKWTCPFPISVKGNKTLADALHSATTKAQQIDGYDWDNVELYVEEEEIISSAQGISSNTSESGSADGSTDSSDSEGSSSDGSLSENGSDNCAGDGSDDSSSSSSDSSSSSSSCSSGDQSGRWYRLKRCARRKCMDCSRRVFPFLSWPDDESSGYSSYNEMSFYTVASFTNTTDSTITSSSSSTSALSSPSLLSTCSARSEDEGKWTTERITYFNRLPRCFFVHLKRFDYVDGRVEKIADELDVPFEIDLALFLTDDARLSLSATLAQGNVGRSDSQKSIEGVNATVGTMHSEENYGDVSWVDASIFISNRDGSIERSDSPTGQDSHSCKKALQQLNLDDANTNESISLRYQLRGALVYIDAPSDPHEEEEEDQDGGHYVSFVRLDDDDDDDDEKSTAETLRSNSDESRWVCIDDEKADFFLKPSSQISGASSSRFAESLGDILSGRSLAGDEEGSKYATVLLYCRL